MVVQQKKAIRILAKKCYTKELFKNYILSLKNCYHINLAKLVFRWKNSGLPASVYNLFDPHNKVHNCSTRIARGPHLYIKKSRIKCMSFLMEAPRLWFNLPEDINNIKLFKTRLKKYLINSN